MTDERYRAAFEEVKRDCEQSIAKINELRRELDAETEHLAQLKRLFNAFADMYGEATDEPMGLTDAIREVFASTGRPLTAAEVRGQFDLSFSRFSLRGHKNPDASIATVIKRLEEAGEVRRTSKEIEVNGRKIVRLAWVRQRGMDAGEDEAGERTE